MIKKDGKFEDSFLPRRWMRKMNDVHKREKKLLYSWRLSRHRAPIHWLVRRHTTFNNETVCRQLKAGMSYELRQKGDSSLLLSKCWPLLDVTRAWNIIHCSPRDQSCRKMATHTPRQTYRKGLCMYEGCFIGRIPALMCDNTLQVSNTFQIPKSDHLKQRITSTELSYW